MMMLVDAIGYLAASLVLATFCMRHMVALRLVAMASNVAFIGYGLLAGIDPVLLLHVLLLPMNALRLAQAARPPSAPAITKPRATAEARAERAALQSSGGLGRHADR